MRFFSMAGVTLLSALGTSVRAQPNSTPSEEQVDAQPAAGTEQGEADSSTPESGAETAPVEPGTPQAALPPPQEVPLPSFLDTTDRRITDERPPPTPAQVAALREMEAEVARFTGTGGSYRNTVVSLVRREYLRQRRARDQWYARQIAEEENLVDEARERAIRQFERFIARYPSDERYTPDAMFRLGELYFERSSLQFQQAFDTGGEGAPDVADFNATIDLYRRLVRNFPDYRRIDGVYYLIGYCLNEMGRQEEALEAWLALVCANRYTYDPDEHTGLGGGDDEGDDGEGDSDEQDSDAHPALSLDAEESEDEAEPGVFVDPYAQCEPVHDEAEFLSETWFRIGEYHFDDYSDPNALELSISAYQRIIENPEDRNYNLALYKVAWAYYRASRYPEAIQHFGMLVQWSDDERQRTGRAGSQLRPEAVQYLGIAFAYDDWNENGLPDRIDGMPEPIARVQNPELLPQDRTWTPEVYFQLGQVFFDEAKYPQAIEIWRLALSRWPNHPQAPSITNMIARAHERNNERLEAIGVRSELGNFTEGSAWWNANLDHPSEQREAEELAETALIQTAVYEHSEAQRDRRRCVELIQAGEEAAALVKCGEAQQHYLRAAEAYRRYLERYPNNPQAYELQYNLADALYWSESYEDAAVQYAAVRDSNLDDAHLAESARRVVESLRRMYEQQVQAGTIQARDQPPPVEGNPPRVRPVQMPQLLQRLAQARELYIARVSEEQDSEGVRAPYEYNNALLLYWYGYWPQAKERFERIFEERCSGSNANETGLVAWENLRAMAIAFNDTDEIERLARTLSERQCTFDPEGEACPERGAPLDTFCANPDNEAHRCCLADDDLTAIEFQRALEVFREAQGATGEQQVTLYERAATMLVEAVNQTPNHEQAPIALEQAAIALEQTQRFDSAAQLYQRIIDEVGPRTADDAQEQESLDAIVANAYFRVAFNANRGFDFERAVQNYRTLVDSPRFASSSAERIQQRRVDALVNTAIIFERLQRYREATRYYREVYESPSTSDEAKRSALYRIAEIAYQQENWNLTIREMRNFISRYQGDRDAQAQELVVQAHWRIAQARKEMRQTRDYQRALQDVITAFQRSGQQPGSIAAEYAANAQFLLTDANLEEFEDFAINPGRPATLDAYVNTVAEQITEGEQQARRFSDGYDSVKQYRRPTWTIAAFVQQGRVFEILARAVLNTPFAMPADLQRQLRRVDQYAREDIRIQVEDRIRQVLDERVRPIECLAVARYSLAARAARAGSIDDEFTRTAIDRLQAYGDERIAECIAEEQARDASFGAYQPGEFTRAPRGQVREVDADITPPALAR